MKNEQNPPNQEESTEKKWEYVDKEDETPVEEEGIPVPPSDRIADDPVKDELGSLSHEELVKRLEVAQEEAAANFDRFARSQAELKNIQHTAKKDVDSARKYALKSFSVELLQVVDNFERTMENVPDTGAADDSLRGMLEGIELTHKSLMATLEKFGVEMINPLNETFNPEFHEAMSMVASPDAKPNTVIQVLQKGYMLNDRLIRPAMVMVSK